MEANNKKKKTIFILTILVIAAVAICVIGIFAKKAYDRHQEEIRIQAIETKNGEIDQEYENFEKEQDRDKKLETLKNEVANATEYEKTEGAYEECSAHYAKMIAQMKSYFVNDYDVTIKTISDEIGDGVEKVEDKDKLKKACSEFATFQDTLKKDYENHGTIEEDKFKEYNDTVDTYVKKYSDRVSAIEKAEEEAKKKPRKKRKRRQKRKQKRKLRKRQLLRRNLQVLVEVLRTMMILMIIAMMIVLAIVEDQAVLEVLVAALIIREAMIIATEVLLAETMVFHLVLIMDG